MLAFRRQRVVEGAEGSRLRHGSPEDALQTTTAVDVSLAKSGSACASLCINSDYPCRLFVPTRTIHQPCTMTAKDSQAKAKLRCLIQRSADWPALLPVASHNPRVHPRALPQPWIAQPDAQCDKHPLSSQTLQP